MSNTVSAPVLSAPVEVPAFIAEAAAFSALAEKLMQEARNLGPEAIRHLFTECAKRADVKSGALTLPDSLSIGAIFGAGPDAKHIGAAVASARKDFRSRLGTADAVAKDRFPFKGETRNNVSGMSIKYTARYAAGVKGSVQD